MVPRTSATSAGLGRLFSDGVGRAPSLIEGRHRSAFGEFSAVGGDRPSSPDLASSAASSFVSVAHPSVDIHANLCHDQEAWKDGRERDCSCASQLLSGPFSPASMAAQSWLTSTAGLSKSLKPTLLASGALKTRKIFRGRRTGRGSKKPVIQHRHPPGDSVAG
jgi:hypothetical protein